MEKELDIVMGDKKVFMGFLIRFRILSNKFEVQRYSVFYLIFLLSTIILSLYFLRGREEMELTFELG